MLPFASFVEQKFGVRTLNLSENRARVFPSQIRQWTRWEPSNLTGGNPRHVTTWSRALLVGAVSSVREWGSSVREWGKDRPLLDGVPCRLGFAEQAGFASFGYHTRNHQKGKDHGTKSAPGTATITKKAQQAQYSLSSPTLFVWLPAAFCCSGHLGPLKVLDYRNSKFVFKFFAWNKFCAQNRK